MGRPRKPTRVLELTGAFRHDPQRRRERENEPEPTPGLGKPPACLSESQKARWREIAKYCPWLTVADRPMVEMTARLWQLMRDGAASVGEIKQLAANLAHLGMTPADRSKIKVPNPGKPAANRFAALRKKA